MLTVQQIFFKKHCLFDTIFIFGEKRIYMIVIQKEKKEYVLNKAFVFNRKYALIKSFIFKTDVTVSN